MNVVLCLLVIFIHASSEPVSKLLRDSWQHIAVSIPWRLSAFVVQGFLFLGGLKLTLNHPDGVNGRYFLSRIKSIFLPYILWVAIYYAYFILIGWLRFCVRDFARYAALGNLVSHFYYIVILAQFTALTPLLLKICRRSRPLPLLAVCLGMTVACNLYLSALLGKLIPGFVFRYNDRLFTTYLFYWTAGMAAGLNYERFREVVSERLPVLALLFAVIAAAEAVCYRIGVPRVSLTALENMHTLYCAAAIVFVFALCVRVTKSHPLPRLVSGIDGVSYLIYLVHPLVIFIVNAFLDRLGLVDLAARYGVRLVIVYTVSIGAALAWRSLRKLLRSGKIKIFP